MSAPLVLRGQQRFSPRPGCRRDGAFVYATAGTRPGASDKGSSAAPGEQDVSCGQPLYPRAGVCAVPGAWRKPRNRRFLTRPARQGKQRPAGGVIFAPSFFELSRRRPLAIFPESGQGLPTVLTTPKLGGNATDIRRFFMPFFQKSRLFLTSVSCYKSICCRVLPICPGRKAKGGKPLLVAVVNTRHRYSQAVPTFQLGVCTMTNFPAIALLSDAQGRPTCLSTDVARHFQRRHSCFFVDKLTAISQK